MLIDALIMTQKGRPVAMLKSLDDDSRVKTRLCQYEALKDGRAFEDGLVVYLWLNTPIGYRYVPVAAIQDNPKASDSWKKLFVGTPAGENCHLVKKEELQMQLHGITFFVGWTKPIPLLPNQEPLPPSAIIFEATGKLRTLVFSTRSLSGMVAKNEANCFDAFLTFIHEKVKYQGPATDGLFARELHTEWH